MDMLLLLFQITQTSRIVLEGEKDTKYHSNTNNVWAK